MTEPRHFTFLVNPTSGGGAAPQAVVPVARLLREAGARVEVAYSPEPAAVSDLVDAAVGRGDVVVCVGGDGMLSSVVGIVAARGGVLGLLPAGRGNDFARMLGIPEGPVARARLLLEGAPHRIDLLAVSGVESARETPRLVAGSVYAGVDARAAALVDRLARLPTRLQYPWAAVHSLATYRPGRYLVRVDDVEQEFCAATVVVANSAYYGNGMKIAPGARLDDGLLDVVVIEAASRLDLLRSLPTVYDGSHVARPEVTVLRGSRVELRGAAPGSIPVGGDGEPLGILPGPADPPVVVEVRPGALEVIA